MQVPLGRGAYRRPFGKAPEVVLLNRFFEQNPANQVDGVALLSRPGSTYENSFGDGPIRKQFNLPGIFDYDNFVVSGEAFFRYAFDGTTTQITGTVADNGTPSIAGVRGADYERVFVADGATLQYYGGQAYGSTLNYTAGAIADDTVVIDGVYYKFASAGFATPAAGTVGDPYLVNIAGTAAQALANLRAAVNASGVAGTDYSNGLVENPRLFANANTATSVSVRGRIAGPLSPVASVSVITDGGADGLAWTSGNLVAGAHVLYGIPTPDDVGIVSVTVLDSFVLCVVANSQRVYFIRPGETTIDPLDFFEAESEPDELIEAITVGDQVWLIGHKSIEPWYSVPTDDPTANPFARVQGRPFSIGALEGTVVKLANSVFLVGDDYIVYRITGGPQPISNPAIVEAVRRAKTAEKANP